LCFDPALLDDSDFSDSLVGQKQMRLWLLSVILALVGCSGSHESTSRAELEDAFKDTFGFSADSKIATIRYKTVQVGDSWAQWMVFTYDPPTLGKIVGGGFTFAPPEKISQAAGTLWGEDLVRTNPNAPTWWKIYSSDQASEVYFYVGDEAGRPSYRYLWIDRTQGLVYAKRSIWQ
jgi:hypothetical protein